MSYQEDSKEAQSAHEIDYRETADITRVHAAIEREKKEPLTANVPVPLWLMLIFFLVFGWGTYYLGKFEGGFSADVYNENAGGATGKKAGLAQGGGEAAKPETPVEAGKKVFLQNCATCHQPTGLGVPGQYPPLAGSEYVNGGTKRLSMILLKGLQGPVKVKGGTFNGAMPTWAALTDKKIADVLTYVRQEWGNTGGEVAPEQIAHARAELKDRTDPWVEADLQAVPADAMLEGAPAAAPAASAKPAASAVEAKK